MPLFLFDDILQYPPGIRVSRFIEKAAEIGYHPFLHYGAKSQSLGIIAEYILRSELLNRTKYPLVCKYCKLICIFNIRRIASVPLLQQLITSA